LGSTTKQIARKIDEKRAKAQFIAASTLATIVEMGDCFHHDFQIGG
jgi:16S rRNA C1402 N4-methylase RsmH